jgi:aspartate aminotransferase
VILHACAHNPTGIDPTRTQWEKIAEIVAKKRLFVVFDSAYQGFASGDPDSDAWAIRYFYSTFFGDASLSTATPTGMIVCQSFSKNFGLYGERIGALHLVTPPSVSPRGAYTHLVRLVRSEISCPSLFGQRCVHTILTDLELRSKWEEDVKIMASRIQRVRMSLKSELENIGAQGNWDHIERQIGMFSYTGLSKTQVRRLKEVHHVYMLENGRMSLSGLNGKNVAYVARAIKDVVDRD